MREGSSKQLLCHTSESKMRLPVIFSSPQPIRGAFSCFMFIRWFLSKQYGLQNTASLTMQAKCKGFSWLHLENVRIFVRCCFFFLPSFRACDWEFETSLEGIVTVIPFYTVLFSKDLKDFLASKKHKPKTILHSLGLIYVSVSIVGDQEA